MKRPPRVAPPVPCVGAFGMGRVSPSGQWVKCPMNTRTKDPTRFPPPPPPQVQPRLRYALTLTPPQRECSVSLPSPLICGKRPCGLGVGTGLDQQGRGSAHPRHRPSRPARHQVQVLYLPVGQGTSGPHSGREPRGDSAPWECVQGTP